MISYATGMLTLDFDDEVAELTLAQPALRNAISAAMWSAIPEAIDEVHRRSEIEVLILRGSGGHFSAGADIGEFDRVFADRESTLHHAATMAAAMTSVERLEKPSIAMIAGACVGAAVALALACDLRIAATDARFGVTPARLGLMYSLADTRRLVDAIGAAAAKDLLFSGRLVGAETALAMRLVNELQPPSDLHARVVERARLIASVSQWSVRRSKKVVDLISGGSRDETPQTLAWFADAVAGEDHAEGRQAFRQGRKPKFVWR